ncbi:MAG: hypothetical protein JWL65_7223 [Gammaproteobacteria bacterium]|nr:hypothetical protein [Gammaproteobacteria bacterium]
MSPLNGDENRQADRKLERGLVIKAAGGLHLPEATRWSIRSRWAYAHVPERPGPRRFRMARTKFAGFVGAS